MQFYDTTLAACGGFASFLQNISPGACITTNDAQDKQVRIAGSASCNGESVNKTIPTPTFASSAKLCGGGKDSGGCTAGEICVPNPPSGFAGLCVYQKGDHACPAGFKDRSVYYESFTDTRNCSNCVCNPSGWNCSATLTGYQGSTCSGSSTTASVSTTKPRCTHNLNINRFKMSSITKVPGSCGVTTNTQLTGKATPTVPTTVCCH